MGIEGERLEDHRHVALLGRHQRHPPLAEVDLAAGRLLQARQHVHGGGLAAAGGAEEDEQLLVLDLQDQIADGLLLAESLMDMIQPDVLALGARSLIHQTLLWRRAESAVNYNGSTILSRRIQRWKMKATIATGIMPSTVAAAASVG
jgi:hypothetical protein